MAYLLFQSLETLKYLHRQSYRQIGFASKNERLSSKELSKFKRKREINRQARQLNRILQLIAQIGNRNQEIEKSVHLQIVRLLKIAGGSAGSENRFEIIDKLNEKGKATRRPIRRPTIRASCYRTPVYALWQWQCRVCVRLAASPFSHPYCQIFLQFL